MTLAPEPWTPEEDAVLRRFYPTRGAHGLIEMLGRSRLSIKTRASKLGMKMRAASRKRLRQRTAYTTGRESSERPPALWENRELRERIFAGVDFGSEPSSPARYRQPPQRPATHVDTQSGIA